MCTEVFKSNWIIIRKLGFSFLAAVTKAIEEEPSPQHMANHVNGKIPQGMENHDSIISSYKELIRRTGK